MNKSSRKAYNDVLDSFLARLPGAEVNNRITIDNLPIIIKCLLNEIATLAEKVDDLETQIEGLK